jgi:clan AA aspartic protease (TIGR02281 family)
MDQEAYHYIAPLADEPLLRETKNPQLLLNVIRAIRNIYGIEQAVNVIEGPAAGLGGTAAEENSALQQFHLELYLEWIKDLIDEQETAGGWQVYHRARPQFTGSPDLHLLAVELALADGDWAAAERLLYQRQYPTALREKRQLLAERISELKGRENRIVISFSPGAKDIPVAATINEQLDQEFLVDTGASFVTVPLAAVKALGLEETMSPDRREVRTAGGTVYASTVTLAAVELEGWVVADIQALVLDLPDRPGVGLLGLNFLNRFRMDLHADEGMLILEPK